MFCYYRLFTLLLSLLCSAALYAQSLPADEPLVEASSAAALPARIVVTVKPLAFLANSLFPGAQVEVLIGENADPHSFLLAPSQLQSIGRADLVLWLGGQEEPWLEKILSRRDGAQFSLARKNRTKQQQTSAHETPLYEEAIRESQQLKPYASDPHKEEKHAHEAHTQEASAEQHLWLSREHIIGLAKALQYYYQQPSLALLVAQLKSNLKSSHEQYAGGSVESLAVNSKKNSVATQRNFFLLHNALSIWLQENDFKKGFSLASADSGTLSIRRLMEAQRWAEKNNPACLLVFRRKQNLSGVGRLLEKTKTPVVEMDILGQGINVTSDYPLFYNSIRQDFLACFK